MRLTGVPWDSRWKQIPDFPNYWVNQYGQVFNMKLLKLMSVQYNHHGVVMVNLYGSPDGGPSRQFTRGTNKLARELFSKEQDNEHDKHSRVRGSDAGTRDRHEQAWLRDAAS